MRNSDTIYSLANELAIQTIQAHEMVKQMVQHTKKMIWTSHKLKIAQISGGNVCIHYEKDVKKHQFGLAKVYCGSMVRTVRFYHMSHGQYIIDVDSGGKKYKKEKTIAIPNP